MSSSVGMMTFPTEWKNRKCSKPPTSIKNMLFFNHVRYLKICREPIHFFYDSKHRWETILDGLKSGSSEVAGHFLPFRPRDWDTRQLTKHAASTSEHPVAVRFRRIVSCGCRRRLICGNRFGINRTLRFLVGIKRIVKISPVMASIWYVTHQLNVPNLFH